jgi:transcription initiation factor TFIIIB Brf1 subunit/transcription initiation factor TFIIB
LQRVAASCVWLAAKLEESPRKIHEVLQVFNRMEQRRGNAPLEFLESSSQVKAQSTVSLTLAARVCKSLTPEARPLKNSRAREFTSSVLTVYFDVQKYEEMKTDLIRTERHLLKEMGFICHVEHPHKFIISYLKVLGAPSELMQVAWNLANDRYILHSARVEFHSPMDAAVRCTSGML